jgi:biotin carboxyl carrier protein
MELIYNDKNINAEISRTSDGFTLKTAGREAAFNIIKIAPGIYTVTTNGITHRLYIADGNNGIYVNLDGYTFEFQVPADNSETRSGASAGAGLDDYSVLPPMPSKVVKILVEKGQTVKEGDGLVILESMKMENLVKSRVNAVVEEVNFADGALVDTGQVVIKLIPVEE